MKPIIRRSSLAIALALALSQASAAPADTRVSVSAHRQDLDTLSLVSANPNFLLFRAGAYDPTSERLDTSSVISGIQGASSNYAVLQFTKDSIDAGRQQLLNSGAEIVGYVPNNAYVVRLNGHTPDALKLVSGARAAEQYANTLKVDPRLWEDARSELPQHLPHDTIGRAALDIVDIRGFRGESSQRIEAALKKLVPSVEITGRSVRAEAAPYVHAAVSRDQLDALLQAASRIDGVSFIEPWVPTRTLNAAAIGAIQGNSVETSTTTCPGSGPICGPTPMFDHGIFGTGQIVAVADSGVTPWGANFTTLNKGSGPNTAITVSDNPPPVLPATGATYPDRKIFAYWLQPTIGATGPIDYDFTSGHGTHVSGSIAGDLHGTFNAGQPPTPTTFVASTPTAANHELDDGMAPNAQLLLQDVGGTSPTAVYVTDFAGTLEQAFAGGARLHNNSWGGKTQGNYNGNDAEADRITWLSEDMLVLVAAGNDGSNGLRTGSPSNAKNVLSVAALARAGGTSVAGFSSRGPAADGRQKPDIAAPGSSIQSARNGTTLQTVPTFFPSVSNSGTSMATPVLTGNAALMRQYFADGFYPRGEKTSADIYDVSGMVAKAILLNGTRVLVGSNWPNRDSGWGRAWLDGNLWFKTTLAGGDDSRRTRIFERTQAAGLRTGESNEYVIHNVGAGAELRATLTWFDPEATDGVAMTLINNLDLEIVAPDSNVYKGNVITSGVSVAGGSADTRDTVEQVRLTAPVAGSYTFRVKATSVPGNGRVETHRQGYALVVSGAFGLPDSAPAAAPTSVAVASNNTSGVAISFSGTSPQGFQLYRADGTCATAAAGSFRLVGTSTASPIIDTSSQGGKSYAYKLRAISGDVEGQISSCIDVVSADDCTLHPTISVNSMTGDGRSASCSVSLTWQAANQTCPTSTGATYKLFRSTDPFAATFTEIESSLPSTSYIDTAVSNGTAYYYRFQAIDSFGNQSPISNVFGVTPTGLAGPAQDPFVDNADGGSYMVSEPAWGVSNLAASEGSLSYHTGGRDPNHPDLTCESIETPAIVVPSADSQLSFSAKYNLEYQWDGVVSEISTDNGATWTDLPPDSGYPSVYNTGSTGVINACGFPNGKGIYTGVTTATSYGDADNENAVAVFKPFTANLSAYAGQTVKIRWRLSSDPGLNFAGMFIDQIRVGRTDNIFRDGFDPNAYTCQ